MAEAAEKWLSVVGVGADGLDGLGARARALIDGAQVLAGGERHLSYVAEDGRPRITWSGGLEDAFAAIEAHAGKPVCVLASGDPLQFGISRKILQHFGAACVAIEPGVSSFALAAARMGWPLSDGDVVTLSCHNFPVSILARHVSPGVRLIILSRDGGTPGEVAAFLSGAGYGASPMTVFEALGGPEEKRWDAPAEDWSGPNIDQLNTITVKCIAGRGADLLPCVPGLDEALFQHDGKITKREVRAATLARLMPLRGQVLWDVGSGSGAVAIEWLRAAPGTGALAFEAEPARIQDIEANRARLGVPHLEIIPGRAPDSFPENRADRMARPDAIFIGGGVSDGGLIDACWSRLGSGGRLVANGVTLEGAAKLMEAHARYGGELSKLAVSRAGPVGAMTAFRPLMEVTQWSVRKESAE